MAEKRSRSVPPATTPEAREDQLTAMALNAMEKRVQSGKATGAELIYLAKLGSVDAKLEREVRMKQKELMSAKTEAIQSAKRVEELYAEAIDAMREYGGIGKDG